MAESDRRHKYAYNRVLIETERILDPQFDDAVVFLSGAQLEMLRNVTQYLNRRNTYVSEQFLDYYLAPTVADYDVILAIVADMEESLMGNPNTIWGYDDRWEELVEHTMIGAGSYNLVTANVPDGYVYTLQALVLRNIGTAVVTSPYIRGLDTENIIGQLVETESNVYRILNALTYVLKVDDKVVVRFINCEDADEIEMRLWGYKTVVPTEA
jgi:hypothetical protein